MTRRGLTHGVLWAAIAATTLGIWMMSLQSAAVSLGQSEAAQGLLVSLFGEWIVDSPLYEYIRKVGHLAEFGLLGIEWGIARRVLPARRRWLSVAAGPLTAACDELLQLMSVGRSAQVADVLLDSVGYALGVAAVWAVCRLLARRK